MTLKEKMILIHRVHELIRRKATGSPKDLAARLEINERQWYRLLNDMKDMGLPVLYCKDRKSYYYDDDEIRLPINHS